MFEKKHQNSGTLGKDTINKWIISFLSVGKRGFKSNFDLASIFLLILKRLKTPRWRKLAACAQFTIHNSLPVLPVPFVPPVPQFKIQNSKFTILSPIPHTALLRHIPPFEGSPRAGAAEYVLRGDVNNLLCRKLAACAQFKIQNSKFKIPFSAAAKVIFFGYIVKILYLCI